MHDTKIGGYLLEETLRKYPEIKAFSCDQGYRGTCVRYVEDVLKKVIFVSKKIKDVLPTRWIVERTFAWFNGFRRLSKDYEIYTASQENIIRISMIKLLLDKLF